MCGWLPVTSEIEGEELIRPDNEVTVMVSQSPELVVLPAVSSQIRLLRTHSFSESERTRALDEMYACKDVWTLCDLGRHRNKRTLLAKR